MFLSTNFGQSLLSPVTSIMFHLHVALLSVTDEGLQGTSSRALMGIYAAPQQLGGAHPSVTYHLAVVHDLGTVRVPLLKADFKYQAGT